MVFSFLKQISINKPLKLALLVRTDLGLTKGKIAAQCSHASIMCYEDCSSKKRPILKHWLLTGQPKIVLRVDTLKAMEEIYKIANENGLITQLVRDAGRTQITAGTITVLGIGPDYTDKIDPIIQHLKLL